MMYQQYLIQLVFIVLNVIEAIHDKWQIVDSKGDKEAKDKWHFWSAVYYVVMVAAFAFILKEVILFPLGLLYRQTVFNYGLNVARGLSFWHIGNRGLDALQTKYFGTHASKIVFVICFFSIIILNLPINYVQIFKAFIQS